MLEALRDVMEVLLTVEYHPEHALTLRTLFVVYHWVYKFYACQHHCLVLELVFTDTSTDIISPAADHWASCLYLIVRFRRYPFKLFVIYPNAFRFVSAHN